MVNRTAYLGFLAFLIGLPFASPLRADDKPVQVALVESIFAGQDRDKVIEQIRPFSDVVQKETGAKANFAVRSFAEVQQQLPQGEIEIAILTGLEYGWLRGQNENAKALLVAGIDPGATRTVVIVRAGDQASGLTDLLGAKVAALERMPFLSQFYLTRTLGKKPDEAFNLVRMDSAYDAIESVIDGRAAAAILTASNLDAYKEFKGQGRFKKLKVLHESPDFPPAAVIYSTKNRDQAALDRFERALLKAGETGEGQRVLTLYKLKGFEKVPADYDQKTEQAAKQFPQKSDK